MISKKLTNSDPFRKRADKHSIYTPIRRLLSRGNTSPLHNIGPLFAVAFPWAHPLRRVASRRIPVFAPVVSAMRCRTIHPSGSRHPNVSLHGQTSAPGTCVPQKIVGSLPSPLVSIRQSVWLPLGSSVSMAHGRGVTSLPHAVVGHVVWVEAMANQGRWLSTTVATSLSPQPNSQQDLSQRLCGCQRAHGLAS